MTKTKDHIQRSLIYVINISFICAFYLYLPK